MSKKWGIAQNIYYQAHPDLKHNRQYSQQQWEKRTIQSLIEICLGLWKDRCEILHGKENIDKKSKEKQKLILQVKKCYESKDKADKEHAHIFNEELEEKKMNLQKFLRKCCCSLLILSKLF